MTRINRRQALALLSSPALSTACATQGAPEAMDTSASFTDPDIFRHGVASGDPETTSVVIWTRVSTGSPIVDVTWAIYEDPEGNSLIANGSHQTSADSDYTVKVIADGLLSEPSIASALHSFPVRITRLAISMPMMQSLTIRRSISSCIRATTFTSMAVRMAGVRKPAR